MKRNIGSELAARMTHLNEMLASGESVGAISRADVDSPRPALTDKERQAIEWAIAATARAYDDADGGPIKREALRRLLDRLG